ncbi:MAG: BTAD domain-containing putative transcriptional regulator [Chloroflexota bacterium]
MNHSMVRFHYFIITCSGNGEKVSTTNPFMAAPKLSFLDNFHSTTAIMLPQRKVMGLFAYLALEAEQMHSRDSLLGLFWPELPEEDARNNLRVTLARLRKWLAKLGADAALLSTRTDVGFQLDDAIALDVAGFLKTLSQTETHEHAHRHSCPTCLQQMAAALEAYRGPLLVGFYLDDCPAFEEWLFVWRERLHLQAMEVLEELAQGLLENGRFHQATTFTRRQLELDPLHDSAQRRLLRLLAYQGQTAVALSQYQQYQTLLRQELGIEPDVELQQLVQQIKDGTLPLPGTESASTTAETHRHNLPEILTPFIGRETELTQLAERLTNPTYRLITLVGPGGIGKTRLALEAARANLHRYADGAFFIALDGMSSADEMPAAIAEALNVSFTGEGSPEDEILRMLHDKQLLLVIDNLEHIIEAGTALLLKILKAASNVVLLVTSRERLNVQAEDLYRLHGLPYPESNHDPDAAQFAAIRLFVDRAHRLNKQFRLSPETLPPVIRICRLVDGLPLGLELAATWVRDFSIQQIADSLTNNIEMLATDLRDISPRHRNLATVFEYSWQLLTPDEQAVLPQLAVFRGSFSPGAALAVTQASPLTLTRLRYKSLIHGSGNGRYTMHELLRQLALRKLSENPVAAAECQTQHSHYFLDLLTTQAEHLLSEQAAQVGAALRLDLDNIRQGWRKAIEDGDVAYLLQSAPGLADFFIHAGLSFDGAQLLKTAVTTPTIQANTQVELLVCLLTKQLALLESISALDEIPPLTEQIFRLTKNAPDLARYRAETCLYASMSSLKYQSNPKDARVFLEQAFACTVNSNDPKLEAQLKCELGRNYLFDGQFDDAISVLQQALALFETLGHLPGQALAYSRLAPAYAEAYNLGQALVCDREALRLYLQINHRVRLSAAHHNLAETYILLGAYELAQEQIFVSLELARQQAVEADELNSLSQYALILDRRNQLEEAEKMYRATMPELKRLKLNFSLRFALLDWATFLLRTGRTAEAKANFEEALALNQDLEHLRLTTQAKLAQTYLALGNLQTALRLANEVWQAVAPSRGNGLPFPIETIFICYTIFAASDDDRAKVALAMAADVLEKTAVAIQDPAMRLSFLNNVPVNQQLQAMVQAST